MADVNQRTAGRIAVHDHLERVIVQIGPGKVPIVVISFIQEVKAIQTLHPADANAHIKSARVSGALLWSVSTSLSVPTT